MSSDRILYQNWIVELGHDPGSMSDDTTQIPADRLFESIEEFTNILVAHEEFPTGDSCRERIIMVVREAMDQLDESEKEFVFLFHFMGRSYREIAEDSGRSIGRLESLHRRALKRLKSLLAGFVSREFGLKREKVNSCPICNSPHREEIELLISAKKKRDTWRETIRLIRENYNLKIKTPQTLIGHFKFHGQKEH